MMNNCCRDYIEQCAGVDILSFFNTQKNRRTSWLLSVLNMILVIGVLINVSVRRIQKCWKRSGHILMRMESSRRKLFATELYYVAHEVVRLMNSTGWQENSDKENSIFNHPIQGTGADGFKMALIDLDGRLADQDARIVHILHDEIIVETKDDIAGGCSCDS